MAEQQHERRTLYMPFKKLNKFDKPATEGDYKLLTIAISSAGKVIFTAQSKETKIKVSVYPTELGFLDVVIDGLTTAIKENRPPADFGSKRTSELKDFNTNAMITTSIAVGVKDGIGFISLTSAQDTARFTFAAFSNIKWKSEAGVLAEESVPSSSYFLMYLKELMQTQADGFREMANAEMVELPPMNSGPAEQNNKPVKDDIVF